MDLGAMDLGRLPYLMDRLAGMGAGITITFRVTGPVAYVAGWEITYSCLRGEFTVSGKTIPEAVEAALVNLDSE